MKTLHVFTIFAGAAMLTAAPVSLQWSQEGVSLSQDHAQARIGRPATPLSAAGVARRVDRRAYRRAAVYGGLAGAGAYGLGSYYYGGYGNPAYSAYGSYGYPTYGYSGYGYPAYSSSYGYPAGYAYSGYRTPGYASYASYGYPGYGYANTWGFGNWGYGYPGSSYASYGYPGYGWTGYRGTTTLPAQTSYRPQASGAYARSGAMGGPYSYEPTGTFQAYWTAPTTSTQSTRRTGSSR